MEDIVLTVNGNNISCAQGSSILEAAEQHGIKIPNLCHHADLKPFGACRLCLVEDEKSGRLMASCVTPAAPDMAVLTDSPRIKKHRSNIVRLMMAEHPESCVVCSKGNRCQLRQIAAQLGIGEIDLYPMPNYKPLEQANPFIIRDLSKCILCGKCVRADHELVVVGAIDYTLRGFRSRPATVYDLGLETSNCTFCGTCVSICPTGALAVKNTRYVGTSERESFSTCGFCGVGCSLVMGVADNRIIEASPSYLKDSVNGSTLCVRGHFAHDFLNAKERLTQPMIRKEGEMLPVSWDEALDLVTSRLVETKKKYGPQSVGFLGSSKCTNEENYLFQKMARVLLDTNNIDNGGYMAGRPALSLIDERTQGGQRVNPFSRLVEAETIVVLGADPNQSVPVMSYYLKRAAKKGVPIIVIDPRRTELVPFCTVWLCLNPHRDLELINAIAAMLCEKDAQDNAFIDTYTEGFGLFRDGLSTFDLQQACRLAGVDMASLEAAVDLLMGKKIAFVVGHGILQQRYAMQSMASLLNLSLMTGSLGYEGAGFYVIASENNQVGAWDMGAVPDVLPGRQRVSNDSVRQQWEGLWKAKISPDQGLNMVRMIEEAEKGNLKALYIMGENPIRSLPQTERVTKALERLDLLIVQDIVANETTEIADVILPAAAFSEKSGSFTNMEGRIQSFRPVVPPPGNAKADWEILGLLALKMGYTVHYSSIEEIRKEISHSIPMYAELYGSPGVVWIKDTRQRRLFHPEEKGDRIPFSPLISVEHEVSAPDYPFTAVLGSQRYHLGCGTRSSYSERIRDFGMAGEVGMSPEDAVTLDLRDGDTVQLQSRYGSLMRKIRLEKGLRAGLIFVPTAYDSNDAMDLVGLTELGKPDSPGWNECSVTVEKIK